MKCLPLDSRAIEYHVVRSKRLKTSEIIVEPERVVVRTPFYKTAEEVDKMVKRKADWIERKRFEYQQLVSQIRRPSFEPDSTIPYLGKNYPLRMLAGHDAGKIQFDGREFFVTISSQRRSTKAIKVLYEAWLMEEAGRVFENIVRRRCVQLGVRPRQVLVKKLKRRWGSATKSNVLNFNFNLAKAPIDVIDYVVLHELAHLRIRNHSHRFWSLVREFMPNYKHRQSWLSNNSVGLVE
jgi:hypothetical protein